jgi:steroid delta-isomerase
LPPLHTALIWSEQLTLGNTKGTLLNLTDGDNHPGIATTANDLSDRNQTMENNEKIAAVHRYVEAFEKADIDIIRDIYAADAVVEDPVGKDPYVGLDAICTFYESGLSSGAKLELTGSPRCAGNTVAFPFRVLIPGMTIEIIDVFEFNSEGKVASMRAYWGKDNIT